jgi:bifunctional autolysin
MWHSRFLGAILLAVLALLGFTGSQTVLAGYSTSSEFSMSQPQETQGFEGSFQLAVMGGSTVPLNMPPEESAEKVQSEKPAVETPKTTPKVSKPKKKTVKKANVKKAPVKKPVEEDGFLTKTFKQLMGSEDDKKKAATKPQMGKTAGKMPEKEEEGLLTKTLKKLVGGDEKEEKTAKKNALNPIDTAPTGSTTKKKTEEQPKTAKSETKKTLKDSFEKLIGVGAVKDKGKADSKSAKTDESAEETKSAKKKESGGLLDGILGGSDKKKAPPATKQAEIEVKETVKKTSSSAKPRKLAAKKYPVDPDEADSNEGEGRSGENYGGAKKGKNLLKESFKTLVTDDEKEEE